MIVVSDTTPLNYLTLIDQVEILPRLYKSIYVPDTVISELSAEGTPEIVRRWAASPPKWLKILAAPKSSHSLSYLLDRGERDAIELALELEARTLLTDDWRARTAAAELEIETVTTLLILAAASDRGWLDLKECFERLRQTNFRVREETLQELLKRHASTDRR